MFVLTTGNSPIDQGVWCLVKDSIRCHSGTGVQHDIKRTHKETYGTGNSDEYRETDHLRSHRRVLHSLPLPQQNADLCIYLHTLSHVVKTESDSREKKSSVSMRLKLLNIHLF